MKLKYWVIIVLSITASIFSLYYFLNKQSTPCFDSQILDNQIKGFPKPENGICPKGYFANSLLCANSPIWCQPNDKLATTTIDYLEDWQIYENPILGISFSLPPNRSIEVDQKYNTYKTNSGVDQILGGERSYESLDIPIRGDNFESTIILSHVKNDLDHLGIIEQQKIICGSEQNKCDESNFGVKYLRLIEGDPEHGFVMLVRVPTGKFILHFSIYLENVDGGDKEQLVDQNKKIINDLDNILSTLKFTETIIDISNWKTYNNEIHNFYLKYPSKTKVISSSDILTLKLTPESDPVIVCYKKNENGLSPEDFYKLWQQNPKKLSMSGLFFNDFPKCVDMSGYLVDFGGHLELGKNQVYYKRITYQNQLIRICVLFVNNKSAVVICSGSEQNVLYSNPKNEIWQLYNQILLTFRFIN